MNIMKTDAREKKALRQAYLRFLLIPIVLVIFSSVLISYREFDSRKDAIMREQQSRIVSAMIDYRDYVSYMLSIARTIETDYIELLGSAQIPVTYETLFMYNVRLYGIIDKLRILSLNGMETLRVNQNNGVPYVVAEADLQDLSGTDFYRETVELGRNQFLFSGLDLNREHGQIETDPATGKVKPVLRISTPLEYGGERIGYFAANFFMREYLASLRNSLGREGCYLLLLDENGYLYNDADDLNNFGFALDAGAGGQAPTIYSLFPDIDLTQDGESFITENKICSYTAFDNIYESNRDYYLSDNAAKKQIFLIYYDVSSNYANDLHFSYFYHLAVSWKAQLLVWAGLALLYILAINLIFVYDRTRFTNLFSDNRYTKTALRQAIKHGQFVNYYQPIINIQDGSVLGIEALSRWNNQGKVLPPSMFLDEILHYQLGQALDENVFRIVREDRKRFEACESCRNAFISINCCQQTLNSLIKDQPTTLIRLTEEEKKYIVLELLEDIVFNQKTKERIRELYKHNILFAIDDFGTGNSNVAFIRSIENLKVKIDRTFVPVDTTNSKERIIIEAFVKMFIDQGLKLIVEGVETREQCRYMKKLGISGVQGFYFSHPMTIDKLVEFMQKQDYLDKL